MNIQLKVKKWNKSMKNFVISIFVFLSANVFMPIKTFADTQGACGFLPCQLASPCLGTNCNGNSLSLVGTILEFLLSFIFVGILIYGIWLIVQAALKIIRSNGNEEEVQSGYKMIKGAYIGLALIFVGLMGLVIVFVIFNATDVFKIAPSTPEGLTLQ